MPPLPFIHKALITTVAQQASVTVTTPLIIYRVLTSSPTTPTATATNLGDCEFVVQEQGAGDARQQNEFNAEGVVVTIVGGLELHKHHVHGGQGGDDEEHLGRRRRVKVLLKRHRNVIVALIIILIIK